MNDVAAFLACIGDIPVITDAATVRRRSRDLSATFSPIIRRDADDKYAELIVEPREDDSKGGLGALTDARRQRIYRSMADVGALPTGLDVRKGHTLEFVNKRVGIA